MSVVLTAGAHRSANASKLLSCTCLDGFCCPEGWKRLSEDIVRIDGSALPPVLVGRQFEDGEMEVRGVFGGISGGSDVADDLPLFDRVALAQPVSVSLEVGIVIAVSFAGIELVDRRPAGLAFEEACNFAVLNSLHRR